METKFNFKSQVCTSRSQSERLLALGLKKETADCYWWQENDQYGDGNGKWHLEVLDTKEAREHFEYLDKFFDDELFIPAWSLHRLVSLCNANYIKIAFNEKDCWGGDICRFSQRKVFEKDNLYDNLCDCIEWLIKEGYFPKEYLV